MNYYKRHLGDYAKKCGHLSPLEHGVYNLVMDAYYDREQAPTRAEAIRWARARSADEVAAVDAVLAEFFTEQDGRFIQQRIEEELEAFRTRQDVNRQLGARGGAAKAKRTASDSLANRQAKTKPSHKPLATNHTEQDQEHLPEPAAPVQAAALIPLVDGTEFAVSEQQAVEFSAAYPAVDVPAELRRIRAWALSNKPKRKTRSGVLRFVNTWLAKAQDESPRPTARAGPAAAGQPKTVTGFLALDALANPDRNATHEHPARPAVVHQPDRPRLAAMPAAEPGPDSGE